MEQMPLPNNDKPTDKNAAVLAAWNSARVIKGETDPPRMKKAWMHICPALQASAKMSPSPSPSAWTVWLPWI